MLEICSIFCVICVIFNSHLLIIQGNLIIGTTRYQKDFQWVRVSHLGNGITGRCYLATDFETDAKFCVKEVKLFIFVCSPKIKNLDVLGKGFFMHFQYM